jgi:hypothetical protein
MILLLIVSGMWVLRGCSSPGSGPGAIIEAVFDGWFQHRGGAEVRPPPAWRDPYMLAGG